MLPDQAPEGDGSDAMRPQVSPKVHDESYDTLSETPSTTSDNDPTYSDKDASAYGQHTMEAPAHPPNRIREIREAKGISTTKLGGMIGADGSMISRLEKRQRKLTPEWADRISKALGVLPRDLYVEGADQTQLPAAFDLVTVREFDVKATAGSNEAVPVLDGNGEAYVIAEWQVPRDFLPAEYRHASAVIIRVQGDSMAPELMPEDRVLLDASQTFIGPEGIYVIWNGAGVIIKRAQLMPGRNPMVRLTSRNPAYEPISMHARELRVLGRVIGRWEWK